VTQPHYLDHKADYDAMTVQSHMRMVSGWPGGLGGLTHVPVVTEIPKVVGGPAPPDSDEVVTYAIGYAKLTPDAPPNKKSEYCDTSYTALASVIERAAGMSYAEYVQRNVLAPFGITHVITSPMAYDPAAAAQREEMIYYPLTPTGKSVDPSVSGNVPPCYGEDFWPGDEGKWAMSTVDILRFLRGMNNYGQWTGPTALIPRASFDLMFEKPLPSQGSTYLAMAWEVTVQHGHITFYHKGGDDLGCTAGMIYFPDLDVGVGCIFNKDVTVPAKDPPIRTILNVLRATVPYIDSANGWPTYDLFSQYPR
jgi:CubicO group peptidase (beta-lactamase class C family)